jgi:hypothetical protein
MTNSLCTAMIRSALVVGINGVVVLEVGVVNTATSGMTHFRLLGKVPCDATKLSKSELLSYALMTTTPSF